MKLFDLFERTMTIDVSFVKKVIFDNYDEIIESDFIIGRQQQALTTAFQPYNITFTVNRFADEQSQYGVGEGLIKGDPSFNGLVTVVVAPCFKDFLENDKTRNKCISYLASVIKHEFVHREQSARSDNRSNYQQSNSKVRSLKDPDLEYFADPQEIHAFAYEIVEECLQAGLSNEAILQGLRQTRPMLIIKNSMRFAQLYHHFHKVDSLNVLPRLKKLMFQIIGQR